MLLHLHYSLFYLINYRKEKNNSWYWYHRSTLICVEKPRNKFPWNILHISWFFFFDKYLWVLKMMKWRRSRRWRKWKWQEGIGCHIREQQLLFVQSIFLLLFMCFILYILLYICTHSVILKKVIFAIIYGYSVYPIWDFVAFVQKLCAWLIKGGFWHSF